MGRPVVAEMALLASIAGVGVGMLLDATWLLFVAAAVAAIVGVLLILRRR